MSNFAIFRTQKIKSLRELKARSDHNDRTSSRGLEHTDPSKPVILLHGDDDALLAWHTKTADVGYDSSKMRKDAVVGIEWLASASADWWQTANQEQRTAWLNQSMQFIAEKAGGADNILSAHLHEDETTPHIQVLTIPLIEKEIKQRGRRKAGQEAQAKTAWTLSAKDYIGGHRDNHVQLQTDYAASVADVGLRRGVPRKETGARNLAPAKWRAAQAIETDALKAARVAAESDREEAEEVLTQSRTEAKKVIGKADDRAAAMHLGFEAIDAGELIYKGPTEDAKETLVTRRKEAGILPPKGDPFKAFVSLIQPYLKTLTGYAKRLALLTEREAQVSIDAAEVSDFRAAAVLEKKERLEDLRKRRDAKEPPRTFNPSERPPSLTALMRKRARDDDQR